MKNSNEYVKVDILRLLAIICLQQGINKEAVLKKLASVYPNEDQSGMAEKLEAAIFGEEVISLHDHYIELMIEKLDLAERTKDALDEVIFWFSVNENGIMMPVVLWERICTSGLSELNDEDVKAIEECEQADAEMKAVKIDVEKDKKPSNKNAEDEETESEDTEEEYVTPPAPISSEPAVNESGELLQSREDDDWIQHLGNVVSGIINENLFPEKTGGQSNEDSVKPAESGNESTDDQGAKEDSLDTESSSELDKTGLGEEPIIEGDDEMAKNKKLRKKVRRGRTQLTEGSFIAILEKDRQTKEVPVKDLCKNAGVSTNTFFKIKKGKIPGDSAIRGLVSVLYGPGDSKANDMFLKAQQERDGSTSPRRKRRAPAKKTKPMAAKQEGNGKKNGAMLTAVIAAICSGKGIDICAIGELTGIKDLSSICNNSRDPRPLSRKEVFQIVRTLNFNEEQIGILARYFVKDNGDQISRVTIEGKGEDFFKYAMLAERASAQEIRASA